ncbi:NADP-dependent oxidoreductase [Microbacterium sp. NPDC076911]|uniref:quinone oxidoreductase family protein n=1 Tax=Microbacterium sp. NPDC076911 TaxID=3154958 RepID=UPI0034179170
MAEAIVYREFGGPEVLELAHVPEAQAAPGELVIRVEAVGVNPIDWKLRSALRPSPPITEPRRIGGDGAGVITAVGEGVIGFRVGDPVAFFGATGAYASSVNIPASQVHPRPAGVSAAQGAALGIPAGTAYQALRSLAVGESDTLLVHGGSGAVGQAIIQFATLACARVIATSSSRRFDRVRALGAVAVEYGDGLAERVRAVAPDGVTAAIDAAGTDEAIAVSLELVSERNRIATIVRGRDAAGFGIRAFQGGAPDPLSAAELRWREEAFPVALALMAAGRFSVELGPSFALADAAEAHRVLESGVQGKIVLLP